MRVTVIRHGKVNHIWKKSCASAEFDEECRLYDEAPIESDQLTPDTSNHESAIIYISTLPRTRQTAEQLFGKRDFHATDLINEVPMRSAFDSPKRFPLWFWNASARLQWFCNSRRQSETRRDTRVRAEDFVRQLIAADKDCILVTHGFFMHTLIAVMKQHGFTADNTHLNYKNGEAIKLTRT